MRVAGLLAAARSAYEAGWDLIKLYFMVGLPGEKLEMREKRIFINGKPLDEPYVHFLEPPGTQSGQQEVTSFALRERYGPVTVPQGHCFVMGDNRDNSEDSRYWGFVPASHVVGKAKYIYLSVNKHAPNFLSAIR